MPKLYDARGNTTLCSIKVKDQVYLLSKIDSIMDWQNQKAANRFFKRLYTQIYQADKPGWKNFHMLADFRLHGVSLDSLANDTFERAVMKNEADQDRVFKPEEYAFLNIDVEGVQMYGLLCEGKQAESWHKAGQRPELPKSGKVIR